MTQTKTRRPRRTYTDEFKNHANAKGLIIDEVIKEYGLGSDPNRKAWNQLIEDVIQQKV